MVACQSELSIPKTPNYFLWATLSHHVTAHVVAQPDCVARYEMQLWPGWACPKRGLRLLRELRTPVDRIHGHLGTPYNIVLLYKYSVAVLQCWQMWCGWAVFQAVDPQNLIFRTASDEVF